MIDPDFERRVILWAISCRDTRHNQKCATEVFCESLAYLYGEAEPMLDDRGEEIPLAPKEKRPERIKIDKQDVALLDEAYRDRRLTHCMREIIRFRYCYGMSPKRVEERCHLPHKSFQQNVEMALSVFHLIVRERELDR